MVTLGIIAAILLLAIVLILIGAGGFIVGFGWFLLIIADIGIAIWVIVKLIKKLCKK